MTIFTTKTEIMDHIEDRSENWLDQLHNDSAVSDDLLAEAMANNGQLEIGYDFGFLDIDPEGYVTGWEPYSKNWLDN